MVNATIVRNMVTGLLIVLNVPMQSNVHRINHLQVIHLMIGINVMIIQGATITTTQKIIVIVIHLVVVILLGTAEIGP
jgi:hypothetical protein